ncbi:MAG: two-component regulator propeller domain-containing protein [Saprospiraceae bacterium]
MKSIYKHKFSILLTQLVIAICIISCNGQSNVKKQTTPLIQSQNNIDLKLNFEKGIFSIFQDSKGNFWIGSKEEGVCKFDGNNYNYYTTANGLPNNFVRKIQEDKKGNIWLNTGKGICFFNGKEFKTVSLKEAKNLVQFPKNQPPKKLGKWSMDDEDIWFTANKYSVLRYSKGILENLDIPIPKEDTEYIKERNDKPYHYPYFGIKIYQKNKGKLWIGTFNRGVIGYDGKAFEYHNPNNFGVGTIRSIFQDKEGNHWFGSNGGGVYKYDGSQYLNFTKEQGLTSSNPDYDEFGTLSRVWSIEQDKEGNMWFGTADSGLWKFDGEEIINYSIKDGLPSNFVETIYKDNDGQLWFCTGMNSNGILYTLKEGSFQIINSSEKKK